METIYNGRKPLAGIIATALLGLPAHASNPRRFPLHSLALLVLFFLPITARSATQSWNPNGDDSGGNGTWDTGITADWDSGVTWTDSNDALFSGTGGTIDLVTPTANSLTFSATAPYLLQSGTLTLSGSAVTMDSDATIASAITSGNGLYVTGPATLTLTGVTTIGSGNLTVDSGAVAIANGGTVTSNGDGILGDQTGASGTVTVSGSGSSWTNNGTLTIGDSGTGSLVISGGAAVGDYYGIVGDQPGSTGTVTVSGSGSSWYSGSLYAGYSGVGTVLVSNGATLDQIGNEDYVGYMAGSNGLVTVSGSGSSWSAQDVYIGNSGTGTVVITGGGSFFDDYSAYIGANAGATGHVTVSGSGSSWLSFSSIYIGYSGTGTLAITGGANVSTFGTGLAGDGIGSSGTVTVSGSGSTWVNGLVILGGYGTGKLVVTDGGDVTSESSAVIVGDSNVGSMTINTGGVVSDIAGSVGGWNALGAASASGAVTVSGSGSAWVNTGGLYVGDSGTGTLTINNGGSVSSGTTYLYAPNPAGYVGYAAGSTGLVTVSGPGSQWVDAGDLVVGGSGTGTLQITAAGAVSDIDGYIGNAAGSVGRVTVSGSGSNWTNSGDLYIGNSGTGTLLISSGGAVSDVNGWIGYNPNSSGTVTVSGSGSTWTSKYSLYVGESGTGKLMITSGGQVTAQIYTYIGDQVGSSGSVVVDGQGSKLTLAPYGALYVGRSGTGMLTVSNGGTVDSTFGAIGYRSNSTGSATVTGTGSTWLNGALEIDGKLSISNGGTVSTTDDAEVGVSVSATAAVIVSGSGSSWTNADGVEIGTMGTGTLAVTGGAFVSDVTGLIGGPGHGVVTVSGSGSTWKNSGRISIATGGTGSLVITGGGVVTSSSGDIIGEVRGSSGAVTVSGSASLLSTGGGIYSSVSGDYYGGLIVGAGGNGSLTITNGGRVIDPNVWMADSYNSNNTGTVTVSGSGSVWMTQPGYFGFSVGESGTGTLQITNGGQVIDQSSMSYIGDRASSFGSVVVNGQGSEWTCAGNLAISNSGTGILTLTDGGLVTVSGTTTLGSRGALQFDGSSKLTTGSLLINGGTLRTLSASIFTNSATLAGPGMTVDSHGFNSTFSGNFTGAGGIVKTGAGTLALTGSSTLGGALLVSTGGGVQISGGGFLADATGSIGSTGTSSVTVTGNHSTWTNTQSLVTGNQGNGTLTIASGGAVSDASSILGDQPGSLGTATVSGSGSKWITSGNLTVGYSGTGTLAITSGATVADASSFIGYNAGSNGSATVSGSGSKWTNTANLTIGNSGIGTFSITSGGLVSAAGITTIGSAGTLQLDGASTFDTGSLTIKGGTVKTLGALTFAPSATLGTGGATINTNGFNSTFSGIFSGAAGLAKSGSGTLTLTGRSTYSGATSVTAGTLALATGTGHTAALSNTAITVGSGATFAATLGASPVSKSVFAGTTGPGSSGATLDLAPGSAFTMAGSELATFGLLQQNAFSGPAFTIGGASGIAPILTFDIGNAASGTDLLHVTKTVDVLHTGGKINIAALAGDTTLTPGSYDLITSAGGFTGTGGNGFTLTDTTLNINGATYDFSLAHSTIDDEILTVTAAPSTPFALDDPHSITALRPSITAASVPEPGSTASLLTALGIAAASLLRRRRK